MSAFTLAMPRTTLTMDEGRVVRWRKRPGERVEAGETVVEVETDKSVVEVEAPGAGYLRRVLVPEGETAAVGRALALFTERPDEDVEEGASPRPDPTPARPPAAPVAAGAGAAGEEPAEGLEVRASPAVRREARRRGVDLRGVPGSGPGGRILLKDLEAALAQATARPATPPGVAVVPGSSPMRQAVARAMAESWRTIPQFSVTRHVDMAQAETFRQVIGPSFEASRGVRLAVTDLLVQAVALSLRRFPNLNRRAGPTGELVVADTVDVGLAVALEGGGLIVPVLRDAAAKPLATLAVERRQLTARALEGRLGARDLGGATITISNLGPFEVDQFRAIVQPGEVAILAVGRVKPEPRAVDGAVVVRPTMTLTLSVDHRVSDGAEAARFLGEVVARLERSDAWILF